MYIGNFMNDLKTGQSHLDYLNYSAVSQSLLTELSRSPKHLQYYLKNQKEQTEAMKFGTLVHSLTLTPDRVNTEYLFIPEDINGRTNEGKRMIANLELTAIHQNKMMVKGSDLERAKEVANAILSDPIAKEYLAAGKKELSAYVEDETGIQLKARIDAVPDNSNMLVDIKTTEDASKWAFKKSIVSYKYYLQAAFYLDQYEKLAEKKIHFVFIAAEKHPPYAVGVYYLNEATIEQGRKEYKELLVKYKKCLDSNNWPGYTETAEEIGIYIPDEKPQMIDVF